MKKGIILGGLFWVSGLERGREQSVGFLKNGEERWEMLRMWEHSSHMASGKALEVHQ